MTGWQAAAAEALPVGFYPDSGNDYRLSIAKHDGHP